MKAHLSGGWDLTYALGAYLIQNGIKAFGVPGSEQAKRGHWKETDIWI